jgi:hypothetical protein
MRYLAELAKFRSQSLAEEGESLQEGIPPRQRWRALAISMRKIFRRLKNKILYETVPTDDTYS